MNSMPYFNDRTLDRDANGVVSIKPMLFTWNLLWGIMAVVALAAITHGYYLSGGSLLIVSIIFLSRRALLKFPVTRKILVNVLSSRFGGFIPLATIPDINFRPNERIITIGEGEEMTTISYDNVLAFSAASDTTIILSLKDGTSVALGAVSETNADKRQERITNLIKYLYDATKIPSPKAEETA